MKERNECFSFTIYLFIFWSRLSIGLKLDKNALFAALVGPTADEIKQHFEELAHFQLTMLEQNNKIEEFAESSDGLLQVVDFKPI